MTKEANDLEGFNHDLRKLFRNANEDGPQKKQFQFNVGRWAYAIHENKNRGIFPSFDVASERSSRQAGLWQSAVVNLKKNAGGGLAAWSEIQAAALRDRSEIVRQIEILDPQIVIFGRDKKSSKLVPRIFADLRPISDLCYSRKSQYWVRQWHPTPIRTSDRALYEVMISTLGQLPPTAFG